MKRMTQDFESGSELRLYEMIKRCPVRVITFCIDKNRNVLRRTKIDVA